MPEADIVSGIKCSQGRSQAVAALLSAPGQSRVAVIGYRALAIDFSENGRFGKNALDVVQHGPVMGVTFNW